MEDADHSDKSGTPVKSAIAWNATLNRVLLAICFFVWFVFAILKFVTELNWILAAIPVIAAFLAYLFPGFKEFHNRHWFQHPLATAGLSILVTIGVILDIYPITGSPIVQQPLSANVAKKFDFEDGMSKEISLDICNLEPLYQNCYSATQMLSLSNLGFSGKHSLNSVVSLKSDKGQVYSINFPLIPPVFIEMVSAQVFLPEATVGSTIRLLAKPYASDDWKYNDYLVQKPGWVRVYLDLQSSTDTNFNIEEVDVDLFLRPVSVASQVEVRVDDIEMFYNPLSKRASFPVDPVMKKELLRVKNEDNFDLGDPISAMSTVTSHLGTMYQVQTFQYGEVYERDEKAYAIYGPIYDKFKKADLQDLGFPIDGIKHVTSWLRNQGVVMEFEGLGKNQPSSFIFSSDLGSAITEGWIENVYEDNGGPTGWLGLPINDIVSRDHSNLQFFESGYIVYYFPKVDGENDNNRPPVAFPYIGNSMNVIDIKASQASWQDTGVEVEPGQRVYVMQLGGSWRYDPQAEWVDANGVDGLWEKSPIPGIPHAALIGRIGEEGGNDFDVGRWKIIKPKQTGHLFLRMNDDEFEDNEGIISVQVFVYQ